MSNVSAEEFYEDDEPVDAVRAAFEAGEKGLTGQVHGWTQTLDPFGPSLVGSDYFTSHGTYTAGHSVTS